MLISRCTQGVPPEEKDRNRTTQRHRYTLPTGAVLVPKSKAEVRERERQRRKKRTREKEL